MLPIIPFSALLAGYALQTWAKTLTQNSKIQTLLKYLLLLYVLVESATGLFSLTFKFKGYEVPSYLADKPDAPHSIYFMPVFDAPYSAWTHRKLDSPL